MNQLDAFPAGISKMLRIRSLNLSHNKIVKVDPISALHKLEVSLGASSRFFTAI
jgi:Leucine-rich repeat (LRR) protein